MTFRMRKPNPKGETRVSLCSVEGYKTNSPDKDNDINVIHSSSVTMEGVPHDVIGTDEHGNTKLMKPGKNYRFPGNKVTERKA
tara:strand:+ start:1687 stop:1935 length:249 start_codon:yes stop_codon:yes gene_type:complete